MEREIPTLFLCPSHRLLGSPTSHFSVKGHAHHAQLCPSASTISFYILLVFSPSLAALISFHTPGYIGALVYICPQLAFPVGPGTNPTPTFP